MHTFRKRNKSDAKLEIEDAQKPGHTSNRDGDRLVSYKEFSLPNKFPRVIGGASGDPIGQSGQSSKKVAIVNPSGSQISLTPKGTRKMRIRGKDGTDFGIVNATILGVGSSESMNYMQKLKLWMQNNSSSSKSTCEVLLTPQKPLPKTVSSLKPVLPKSTEKLKETSNKIVVVNKPLLKDPKREAKDGARIGGQRMEQVGVKSGPSKISKTAKQVSTSTSKKVKQMVQYYEMGQNAKQQVTVRKLVPATVKGSTVKGSTVKHNTSDVPGNGLLKFTIINDNKKQDERVRKLITIPDTISVKVADPGKSTSSLKTIHLVRFNKLSEFLTRRKLGDIKSYSNFPIIKLTAEDINKLSLQSTSKSNLVINSAVKPVQVARTANINEKSVSNNVTNPVPAVSKTEDTPEKTVEVKKDGEDDEDDIIILYEKKIVPENATSDVNVISVNSQTQEIASSSNLVRNVGESVPQNNETLVHMPVKSNENIKKMAMSALEKCGLNKMQQVTSDCAKFPRYFSEMQTQTEVFGLLDEKSFVSVDDTGNLSRAEPIKFKPIPTSHDVEVQTDPEQSESQQPRPSANHTFDNTELIADWNSFPIPELDEIHNYFNTNFISNEEVTQVKKVLSVPQALCKKVSNQLEKDYEQMQSWDENGLLNIHRAVIEDDFRKVQRLVFVLNASKTNIDVRTENGLTSLELAVEHSSSANVVRLLLDAGAEPVTSELLHDSAVILACKFSSPLLGLLLEYVKNPQLLNQSDTTGFFPLHYCAINGNLNGVNALLAKGVDVNVRDQRSGRTPFFHAVENNHMRVAKRLIQRGGIADIPNFSGQSVMSILDEARSLALMPVLRDEILQIPASRSLSL